MLYVNEECIDKIEDNGFYLNPNQHVSISFTIKEGKKMEDIKISAIGAKVEIEFE